MTIKITKSDDIIKVDNIVLAIYGQPGSGKTTLGLSAKRPLLLDFDKGIQRAALRGDNVQLASWKDIEALDANDLINYDTIVIDTVGRLLEILAIEIIKQNPKMGRATGELALQGYGALNTSFKFWLNKIKSFNKDIILLAHAKESSQNDNVIVRIDAMGSSKDEIYKCSDMLGYLESQGINNISLNFNPTDKNLGKNCAAFELLRIPPVTSNDHYLADLIESTKNSMNRLSEMQLKKIELVNNFRNMIQSFTAPDEFTNLIDNDNITNDIALKIILHKRATELGFEFDKPTRSYVTNGAENELVSDQLETI